MNERLLFTLLLFLIMGLLRIIGYWRREAGKVTFDAARMSNADKERDRYCRLAVMAGHRDAGCSASCIPTALRSMFLTKSLSCMVSEWPFSDIIIHHDTMHCSIMNRKLSAVPSTSSNKEKYTVLNSSRHAWMPCNWRRSLIISCSCRAATG